MRWALYTYKCYERGYWTFCHQNQNFLLLTSTTTAKIRFSTGYDRVYTYIHTTYVLAHFSGTYSTFKYIFGLLNIMAILWFYLAVLTDGHIECQMLPKFSLSHPKHAVVRQSAASKPTAGRDSGCGGCAKNSPQSGGCVLWHIKCG